MRIIAFIYHLFYSSLVTRVDLAFRINIDCYPEKYINIIYTEFKHILYTSIQSDIEQCLYILTVLHDHFTFFS